ncbi:MAG: cupin domain-containing protein [Burkholderiales bacterium]|jgi:quercetin dioxygenase-like cupin family protein|nr:cupin domain-containing protein [Burkholderiales bacterium]
MADNLFQRFENGSLSAGARKKNIASTPWNPHKEFPGVFLKNVVTGEDTGGLLSCHLVRIDPGAKIGLHLHSDSIELHEVIEGSGVCVTEDGEISYAPGCVAVLARNASHEVRAGAEGLYLFAKFVAVTT